MKQLFHWMLFEITKSLLALYRPTVIAVTGTVGKTSTKAMIGAVLGALDRTARVSQESFNTEWGVPLTVIGGTYPAGSWWGWFSVALRGLFQLIWKNKDYPKMLVLEFGADRPGDIRALVELTRPSVGVLTAISPVHLRNFRNLQEVAREKFQLLAGLPAKGQAVVGWEVAEGWDASKICAAPMLVSGLDERADVFATDIFYRTRSNAAAGPGTNFKLHWKGSAVPCVLPDVIGDASVASACLAAAVGLQMGIHLIDISRQLAASAAVPGRMRLIAGIRNTILIDDSYNSSPKAARQAIRALERIAREEGRQTWAVLGDMAELGQETERAHQELGRFVASVRPSVLVTVGVNARMIAAEAIRLGYPVERVRRCGDAWEAGRMVQQDLKEGDAVLVKGSQVMRMERVVKELMARPLEAEKTLVRQQWWWR